VPPRPGWTTAKTLELKKEAPEDVQDLALRTSSTTMRALSPRLGPDAKEKRTILLALLVYFFSIDCLYVAILSFLLTVRRDVYQSTASDWAPGSDGH
jgi:hypothetical protein